MYGCCCFQTHSSGRMALFRSTAVLRSVLSGHPFASPRVPLFSPRFWSCLLDYASQISRNIGRNFRIRREVEKRSKGDRLFSSLFNGRGLKFPKNTVHVISDYEGDDPYHADHVSVFAEKMCSLGSGKVEK